MPRLYSPSSPRDAIPLTRREKDHAWHLGWEVASYLWSGSRSKPVRVSRDALFFEAIRQSKYIPQGFNEEHPSFWEWEHFINDGAQAFAENNSKTSSLSTEDILARQFFVLADKVQEISESDVASMIKTFAEEDYTSVIATLLDAGYWILSGHLEEGIQGDAMGHPLYVRSNVYNDLLYRGFDPSVAWEESGMGELFEEEPHTKESSDGYPPGTYVAYKEDGGIRAGMLLSSESLFSFDGEVESFRHDKKGVHRLTASAVGEFLSHYGDSLIRSVWRRMDAD